MSKDIIYQSKGALIQFVGDNATHISASGGISASQISASGGITGSTLTAQMAVLGNSAPNTGNTGTEVLRISDTTNPSIIIDPGGNTSVDPALWLQDTTTGAGFKLWYDNNTGRAYLDNYYNHANGDIRIRTKVAGTPITAVEIDATGATTFVGDVDTGGDVDLADGQTLRIGGVACVNHTTNTVTVGSTTSAKDLKLDVDTGTALSIDSSGNITKPLQPAFFAYRSGDQSNTQTNGWGTVAMNAERFDVGSDFCYSTCFGEWYAFTAPETGKYFFKCSVRLDGIEWWWDYIWIRLNIDDSRYVYGDITSWQTGGPGNNYENNDAAYWTWEVSAMVDLTAGDWVKPELKANNGSGTTTWVMNGDGDASSPRSYFTGWLVG